MLFEIIGKKKNPITLIRLLRNYKYTVRRLACTDRIINTAINIIPQALILRIL